MGRIDDALQDIESIEDGTERALQMAGLVSTLFKLNNVVLMVTGQFAFHIYANAAANKPMVELAVLSGQPSPRTVLEIMRGQLRGRGSLGDWVVAGVPVQIQSPTSIAHPELCRDFVTEHGVVKLMPAEQVTAEYVLASVYPEPDEEAQTRARLLLINGLMEAFHMDWTVLQSLCHHNDYRVGEELAKMRASAKKDVDAMSSAPDHIGQTGSVALKPIATSEPPAEKPKPRRPSLADMDPNTVL